METATGGEYNNHHQLFKKNAIQYFKHKIAAGVTVEACLKGVNIHPLTETFSLIFLESSCAFGSFNIIPPPPGDPAGVDWTSLVSRCLFF